MNIFEQYITKNDVNQSEMARQLGVSRATITGIKKGRRRPSPELAGRIENLTGINLRDLLFSQISNK